jgi:hypothetical protein
MQVVELNNEVGHAPSQNKGSVPVKGVDDLIHGFRKVGPTGNPNDRTLGIKQLRKIA